MVQHEARVGERYRRMQPWILMGMFFAVAILQSIPRFTVELLQPLMLPQRVILLALFFGVTWFFTRAVHEEMRWGVLSQMFFTETVLTAIVAILLVGQIIFPFLAFFTLAILLFRGFFYAYLISHHLTHLRELVFGAGAILLVIGELIISYGFAPF